MFLYDKMRINHWMVVRFHSVYKQTHIQLVHMRKGVPGGIMSPRADSEFTIHSLFPIMTEAFNELFSLDTHGLWLNAQITKQEILWSIHVGL